jgi:alpha-beta hydrolase superfamily lysophospholipase
MWFGGDTGHARIGEILEQSSDSVTRRVHSVQHGDLAYARRARWAGWWYLTPADLGVAFRDVDIVTPLGIAPAWIVDSPTASNDWVIQVHGRGVTRAEGLRAVSVFRAAGFTSLLISYRNDGDAPPSSDRRYALGGEEWRDVDAAIRYARDHGAQRIVLMGWSMGGAIVLQCVTRSALADVVVGVVLESPVVDWVRVLHYQAGVTGLPAAVRDTAMAILSSDVASRWAGLDHPIDFSTLDMVARASELRAPLLILHSIDDGFVPSDGSVALAHRRADLVRFERFATARHTKLWNYDEPRWERSISAWLADVIEPAGHPAD